MEALYILIEANCMYKIWKLMEQRETQLLGIEWNNDIAIEGVCISIRYKPHRPEIEGDISNVERELCCIKYHYSHFQGHANKK